MPFGLKIETFILTRRDLSSPSLQKNRWIGRKLDSNRKMGFGKMGYSKQEGPWAHCLGPIWDPFYLGPIWAHSGPIFKLFGAHFYSRPYFPYLGSAAWGASLVNLTSVLGVTPHTRRTSARQPRQQATPWLLLSMSTTLELARLVHSLLLV